MEYDCRCPLLQPALLCGLKPIRPKLISKKMMGPLAEPFTIPVKKEEQCLKDAVCFCSTLMIEVVPNTEVNLNHFWIKWSTSFNPWKSFI